MHGVMPALVAGIHVVSRDIRRPRGRGGSEPGRSQ
jgi:hypothetical protein